MIFQRFFFLSKHFLSRFDNNQTLKIAQKQQKYDLKVLEKTYWDVKKCRESKGDVLFAPAGLEIKLLAKNDDTTKSSLWDLGLNC